MADKFEYLVNLLVEKMKMSQVPVPGFILGLSGTDSVLAYLLLYEAAKRMDMPQRVYGIHYAPRNRKKPTWFEREVMPWLRERCPEARPEVQSPQGLYNDHYRWADLGTRALNSLEQCPDGSLKDLPLEPGENYWVAGTLNATEFALGTYSNFAAAASIMPLRKVWKSDIMAMCEAKGVPQIALDNARLPDCICGRMELAAANIEMIDGILRYDVVVTPDNYQLFNQLFAYVDTCKRDNGFKERIPYLL
ncbi:MAG: hypothetical protein EON60_11050 [Alphaproteobacteria bacterium]|nr:MAG: hypothetical protein EON60_11050 [Alphaproteobacteria bacterium]